MHTTTPSKRARTESQRSASQFSTDLYQKQDQHEHTATRETWIHLQPGKLQKRNETRKKTQSITITSQQSKSSDAYANERDVMNLQIVVSC